MEQIELIDHRVKRTAYNVKRTASWTLLLIALLTSCSPKTTPPPSELPVVVAPGPKPEPVPEKRYVANIALALPFQLDKITTKTIQQKDLTRATLALDFYQGFQLAIDSLAAKGTDFKVQVLDSRDNGVHVATLAHSAAVQAADVIIGPVYPAEIKAFSASADLRHKVMVSPLAAAMPTEFNNPKLLSMNNSVDQHATKLTDFIRTNYSAGVTNLILVNTRKTVDETFAAPIRKAFVESKLSFTEVPNMVGIESKLSKTKVNVVLITSFDRPFVLLSVNGLYKFCESYKIDLFGHPNWTKLANLEIEKMQGLNTRITSSYLVDYQSLAVKRFVAAYKRTYKQEPSEYAFKGFDAGYFFGGLLAKYGNDYLRLLPTEKYEGLHTNFQFKNSAAVGYTNAYLMMLRYKGFEMLVEE